MLERLSNLGAHRKIVVFGVLCLDHIDQPLPKPALRARSLLPPLHLALVVGTAFATEEVAVPLHPAIRVPEQ
jgi:hypothetical protein